MTGSLQYLFQSLKKTSETGDIKIIKEAVIFSQQLINNHFIISYNILIINQLYSKTH